MSLRRKILLPLLALLLLTPSVVMYGVVSTEWGLQFITSHLGKMGPVTISVGAVQGTLIDGFTAEAIRVQHRMADVRVDRITGRVELLPLFLLQRVTLPQVQVGRVEVIMLRPPERRPTRPMRFLPGPLRIDLDSVRAAAADIRLASGRLVPLRNVEGSATVLSSRIRVRSARADHEFQKFVASGNVLAERPIGLDGDLEMSWSLEGQPDWLIISRFDGNLDSLPLTGRIEKPFHATFEGEGTTLNRGWKFAGKTRVRDFDLQAFGGSKVLGIISGNLDVTAEDDGFTAKGFLTPPGLEAGAFGVDFRGSYASKVLTIHGATVTHAPSGARATTRGTATVVKGGPDLVLAGEWTRFRWPLLKPDIAFESPQGRYTLAGSKPWNVQLQGDVIAVEQPAMPATLRGVLAPDSLHIDAASVQLLAGQADFSGEARWQPAESWRITGRMNDLDPALIRTDLPGQLSFDFTASGAPFGAMGSLELDVRQLSGRLRGQNISGKGNFSRAGGREDWQFAGVDMSLGRTRVQLDGGFGPVSDLRFAINADDLSLFDADARGRVNATGRYAGTRDTPQLVFNGRGTGFEWKGVKLAALDADVDLDLRSPGHARGTINVAGLEAADRTVQKATLQLAGTGQQQRLTINAEAQPLRAALVAEGGMREGLWQGTLQSLAIDDNRDLQLRLAAPATLAVNLRQQQLGQTCVTGDEGRLCVGGQRAADGTWQATATADALPLRTFTAGLAQHIDYEGTINLMAEFSGNDTDLPVGNARGQLQDAVLRHRLSSGRDERMSLGSGTVTASATTTGFNLQVSMDAGVAGNIRGQLSGDRNAGDWRNYPIRGELDAKTDGLALLDVYVGGIDKATGQLITRVDIGGTLGAPTVQGMLQLRDATIDVYQVNLAMRNVSLDARFNRESLDISGKSQMGQGEASFSGRLSWRDGEPYGDLNIKGSNLRVVDVPEARIDASPDLDFKVSGHRIEASGEVLVPYAQLEPADLTDVVLVSRDEVLVGAPMVDPAQRWMVVYDIRVVMGDSVHIDSLGLRARLGGSLRVRGDESQVVRGSGELNIAEGGRFAYLGRLLDIERGRLIFDNVPLNDPGINLRAQKVYPDITAGVNVRGPLRNPTTTFFSEPAIPQSQIASIILAGGSIESAQNSTRSGAARNALLAQGASILAQPLGGRIGITDVGIEQDLSNDTSLVLGKALSPRLYVSWGLSLAEAINTLKLRYTIGDRWTLKTEAGKARSADIEYTIRK